MDKKRLQKIRESKGLTDKEKLKLCENKDIEELLSDCEGLQETDIEEIQLRTGRQLSEVVGK